MILRGGEGLPVSCNPWLLGLVFTLDQFSSSEDEDYAPPVAKRKATKKASPKKPPPARTKKDKVPIQSEKR